MGEKGEPGSQGAATPEELVTAPTSSFNPGSARACRHVKLGLGWCVIGVGSEHVTYKLNLPIYILQLGSTFVLYKALFIGTETSKHYYKMNK